MAENGDSSGQPTADLTDGPVDKAPYAWLDDPARAAGPVPPGLTIGYGVVFLGAAVVNLVILVVSGRNAPAWAYLVPVVGFGAIGALILRMGLARRAWRRRNPGVDPLSTVPSPTGGSVFGPDTHSAGFFRWVLLVLSWGFALLVLVALPIAVTRRAASPSTASWLFSLVLMVGLVVVFAAVGWFDLRRIRRLRQQRRSAQPR